MFPVQVNHPSRLKAGTEWAAALKPNVCTLPPPPLPTQLIKYQTIISQPFSLMTNSFAEDASLVKRFRIRTKTIHLITCN